MTDERLKELIPDCVGYPVRTRKQTENLRKAVKALIAIDKRNVNCSLYDLKDMAHKAILDLGIPYNEIGE